MKPIYGLLLVVNINLIFTFHKFFHLKTSISNDLENIGQGKIQYHQNEANAWLPIHYQ